MSRPALDILAACTRLAESQHGVVSAQQAIDAGLSRDAIHRRLRSGAWRRVRPCVYALWTPWNSNGLWRQRLVAASLWLGAGSAVSHRAAAVVLELDGVTSAPIEVSTLGIRQKREPGLVVHRVRSLSAEEIVRRDGIPVTSPARTLIDLCAVVEPRVVEMALESVIRRRLAAVEQIRDALDRSTYRAHSRTVLGRLLDEFQLVATESALEAIVWRLLRDSHLPLPQRQFWVYDADARSVARIDFAYPDARVGIEADGYESHSSRRDWRRDRARQNALTQLGWRILRATWEDATRYPRRILVQVEDLLSGSARSRGS